jgi:hypothetical protein
MKEVHMWESEELGLVLLEQEMKPVLAEEISRYIKYLETELAHARLRRFA